MFSPLRSLSFALGLGALLVIGVPGCRDRNLQETTVPAEGVSLRYTLAPGAGFKGEVSQRESVQTSQITMNRSLDFTVSLSVTGVDDRGRAQVKAVIENLRIAWALPPNMPYSVGEFIEGARKKIDGVTIHFVVTGTGEVEDLPPMPEELDAQERLVLQGVLDGLSAAFLRVPERALARGEQWTDESTKGRKGKLGKYSETKITSALIGLYDKTDTKQKVAKLSIESNRTDTTTTKAGGHETNLRSKQSALFDVESNFLVSLTGTDTRFDSGETTTRKFTAQWTRTNAGTTAAVEPEVQQIDDPCHPDYVGPGECAQAGAEVQQIDDPCDPDYVGAEECSAGAANDADAAKDAAPAPDAGPTPAPAGPERP